MPSEFDRSEFVDHEFEASQQAAYASASSAVPNVPVNRPQSKEELDGKVAETQARIEALRRAQERLQQERNSLDELRRKQAELETGHQEMLEHLTRGIGILENAEFKARQDADQMAKSLQGLQEALKLVQGIHQDQWGEAQYDQELVRALTILENARMEWNSSRLKWPILEGDDGPITPGSASDARVTSGPSLGELPFGKLCQIGIAVSWPIALVGLIAIIIFLVAWYRP